MKKKFCVIGDKSTTPYPVSRTWKETKLEAIAYAESLIRNHWREGKPQQLFVVEVVSIVSTGLPKIDVIDVADAPELAMD